MDINQLVKAMEAEDCSEEYIKECTEYAGILQNNGFPVIFDTRHFAKLVGITPKELYSYYQLSGCLYKEIKLKKKSGSIRIINAPSENLKFIQKWILENVLYSKKCLDVANGFIREKSIVDNAKRHVGKACVINLDIQDFFPTINYHSIYNLFIKFGFSKHLALVFTGLCTFQNVLPQGAPTSPYLSNLICENLDKKMVNLANRIGASYSRYADDITFSGEKCIARYIKLIKEIIISEGFLVNEKKVRVHYQYHKQMVTGLVVNEKLSVPKTTKKYLRQQIFYSKKFGVQENLNNQGINKTNYKDHLYGVAYFIKMVEPVLGENYLRELSTIDWDS